MVRLPISVAVSVGIHNTVEAAVYGIPVIFGPNYQKFMEAKELIACGGGFSINESKDLNALLDKMLTDKEFMKSSGQKAGSYVKGRAGAADIILNYVKDKLR